MKRAAYAAALAVGVLLGGARLLGYHPPIPQTLLFIGAVAFATATRPKPWPEALQDATRPRDRFEA